MLYHPSLCKRLLTRSMHKASLSDTSQRNGKSYHRTSHHKIIQTCSTCSYIIYERIYILCTVIVINAILNLTVIYLGCIDDGLLLILQKKLRLATEMQCNNVKWLLKHEYESKFSIETFWQVCIDFRCPTLIKSQRVCDVSFARY